MAKTGWKKRDAFAHFNTRCDNDRWGWSGISADGDVVALTLWSHARSGSLYSDFGLRNEEWRHKLGNRARRRHIEHALARLGGRFRPVHITAVSAAGESRSIRHCEPRDEWWQITQFDSDTGEFSAELVNA